jgi:hypothetical protein
MLALSDGTMRGFLPEAKSSAQMLLQAHQKAEGGDFDLRPPLLRLLTEAQIDVGLASVTMMPPGSVRDVFARQTGLSGNLRAIERALEAVLVDRPPPTHMVGREHLFYALTSAAGTAAERLVQEFGLSLEIFKVAVLGPQYGYTMADGRPVWLWSTGLLPQDWAERLASEASLIAINDMGPSDRSRLAAYCAERGLWYRTEVVEGYFGPLVLIELRRS